MPSRHIYKLPKLSVKGEPHEDDTILNDTLADDDPTTVIAAKENARVHLKSTTELVYNKSNTIVDVATGVFAQAKTPIEHQFTGFC